MDTIRRTFGPPTWKSNPLLDLPADQSGHPGPAPARTAESLELRRRAAEHERDGRTGLAILFRNDAFRIEVTGSR